MRDYIIHREKPEKEIRSDASMNREAIILAAKKLFSSGGSDISMTNIAKEAGVSRATLYRNFLDKSDIILAIFHHNMDMLGKYARQHKDNPDLFFALMEVIIIEQSKYQWLVNSLKKTDPCLEEKIYQIFDAPVSRAKSNGLLRNDFDIKKDLMLLINMTGGAIMNGSDRNDLIRRALDLIREGVQVR